jgi:N-dimethylarginine dimethylaminohydrolase
VPVKENPPDSNEIIATGKGPDMTSWPQTLLMVDPQYFDVEYSINPHMLDAQGQLNKVDKDKARQQWQELKSTFEKTGTQVEVLPGVVGLPDMVFCANQTFPFIKQGAPHLIVSQMHSPQRQPEVEHFRHWAQGQGFQTHDLQDVNFEGMGDALWNYATGQVFAGYGFRTAPEAYAQIETIIGQKMTTFELKDPRFYHLDTCLAILGEQTAAYVEEAFTPEGLATLQSSFEKLISVPIDEACQFLAGNMCTPNGKDVILQKGAQQTVASLLSHGFNVHEVDTSEYIKSGGSVFCMKQMLF